MRTQADKPDRVAREPRAPRTKTPAVDAGSAVQRPANRLGPGEVLQLRRLGGNAAIARLLAGQRSRIAIQRTEQSAALLKTLATPRVGEGPAVEVQTELVDALEKLILQELGPNPSSELNLGGVLIDWLPNTDKSYRPTVDNKTAEGKQQRKQDIQGLFNQLVLGGRNPFAPAQFVGFDTMITGARSTGIKFGPEVKRAGLGPKVVENALKTMIDAEQLEYLRLAGLPNDEWKILVEVHYIRSRPKDMAGFHKDTKGQSLFVNLNYHVMDDAPKPGETGRKAYKVRGPEYVLNPPRSEEHDKLIYGTEEKKGTLPAEFTKDLTKLRDELPKPENIESAGTVEGLGYVAFVDEAIHHATPWFGHRYVTPSELKAYLERQVKADEKYQAWRGRKTQKRGYSPLPSGDEPVDLGSFSKYVKEKEKGKAKPTKGGYSKLESERGDSASFSDSVNQEKWKTWLRMATVAETDAEKRDRIKKYTREDFAGTMPRGDFDLMLEDVGSQPDAAREKAGAGGWYSASIQGQPTPTPIKPKDKPPLERTASQADLTKNWPTQLPEEVPRRFIRTWVRAIPKSLADSLRGT